MVSRLVLMVAKLASRSVLVVASVVEVVVGVAKAETVIVGVTKVVTVIVVVAKVVTLPFRVVHFNGEFPVAKVEVLQLLPLENLQTS